MSDVSINYKGAEIASLDDSGMKTLLTSGKYCEDNIEVAYTKPSGGEATDGFEDVIFNFPSKFSVSMENNSLKNYSTASAANRACLPLKKPISLKSGDVIKMTFTNKSGTTGYSQIYMQTIPFGDVTLNNNFSFTTNILKNGITTTITQEYLEVKAFQIGPRHTTAWSDVNMELSIYVNDVKIF